MTAFLGTLAVFGVLLALYALVLWLTSSGGPCDVQAWWDGEFERGRK